MTILFNASAIFSIISVEAALILHSGCMFMKRIRLNVMLTIAAVRRQTTYGFFIAFSSAIDM
jgi:hypothetical protein